MNFQTQQCTPTFISFCTKKPLKPQNSSEDFAKFWKLVPTEDFPVITDVTLQFLSSFESTYVSEKFTQVYIDNGVKEK